MNDDEFAATLLLAMRDADTSAGARDLAIDVLWWWARSGHVDGREQVGAEELESTPNS